MNTVLIRQVTEEDVSACAVIESLCFEPTEAASKKNILRRQQQFPSGFLIAELDNTIVGFINCGATNEPDLSDEEFKGMIGHSEHGQNLVIFSVAVHPDFQDQGIATKLLQKFIKNASAQRKIAILLLCKTSLVDFYEKFGFINAGASNSTHGGFNWREMQYKF